MAGNIKVLDLPRASRRNRYPQHQFLLKFQPWQIQPFMIAPVLPGETLKRLLVQCRAVSDPIRNPIAGWHLELYFFYVKMRDCPRRSEYTSFVLDQSVSLTNDAASAQEYHVANLPNFVNQAMQQIVTEYFRDEGEAWNVATINNLAAAQVGGNSWMDSVILESTYDNPDVELTAAGSEFGAQVWASEIDKVMQQWQFARNQGLVNMSYEDFLGTYGVKPAAAEEYKPELVRYIRDWTYPTNTVNPSTGAPTTAVSWALAERADKDRFFTEPGWIIGVTCARPKVYRRNQTGSAADLMTTAFTWLPGLWTNDQSVSIRNVAQGAGPLAGLVDAGGYMVDTRDILLYGDQFVNYTIAAADGANVALPTTANQKRYPSLQDAKDQFVDAAGTAFYVKMDGVCSLQIATRQVDQTPRAPVL